MLKSVSTSIFSSKNFPWQRKIPTYNNQQHSSVWQQMKQKVQRLSKFRGHKMMWKSIRWKFWHLSLYSKWRKTHFTSSFKLFMAINDMKAVARSRSSSEYVFAEIRFLDVSRAGRKLFAGPIIKSDLEQKDWGAYNFDKSIPWRGKFRKIYQPSLLLRTESK